MQVPQSNWRPMTPTMGVSNSPHTHHPAIQRRPADLEASIAPPNHALTIARTVIAILIHHRADDHAIAGEAPRDDPRRQRRCNDAKFFA
jgi:hypothetical protein